MGILKALENGHLTILWNEKGHMITLFYVITEVFVLLYAAFIATVVSASLEDADESTRDKKCRDNI